MITKQRTRKTADWRSMTGPIEFSMCNDYLFRAMMQIDKDILAMMLSCFLQEHYKADDIDIRNPIELGKALGEKDFILDTKTRLNDTTILQLWPQSFWKLRSMSYLSRIFDSLKQGDTYLDVVPAIHIGIITFPLDDLTPELYAVYLLKNKQNNEIFSDKMQLHVLCLEHIELATVKDTESGGLMWARYFTAKTWEDLKMLTEEYPVMERPVSEAYRLSNEEHIREMMLLREETLRVRRTEELLRIQTEQNYQAAKAALEESQEREKQAQAREKQAQANAEMAEKKLDQYKSQAEETIAHLKKLLADNGISSDL